MRKVIAGLVVVFTLAGCSADSGTGASASDTKSAVKETKGSEVARLVATTVRAGVVKVRLTNTGRKDLDVNPGFFTALDTANEKYQSEITGEPDEIKTAPLEPGVRVSGNVHFPTKHKLVKITFTDPLGGEIVSAPIAD